LPACFGRENLCRTETPVRFFVGCLLLSFATGVPVQGAEWFVDNVAGSDLNDGTARDNSIAGSGPFRTINRAMNAAGKGDTVILNDTGEAYRETIAMQGGRHSGTADFPFRLVGNGAVLDGTTPVPHLQWEHHRDNVFRYRPYRLHHQILYDAGLPLVEKKAATHGAVPELAPKEWAIVGGYIYFCTEPGKLPLDYDLACALHPVGITLYEVRHVEIRDVILQGYQIDGINVHSNAFDVEIVDVTSRGNGRSGVSFGGASRASLIGSLVGDNREAQVRAEGQARVLVSGCEVLANTAPAIVEAGGYIQVENPVGEAAAVAPASAELPIDGP
jgi:hypothetical protein